MGTSWNDLSESEKDEIRGRTASMADKLSERREEFEAKIVAEVLSWVDC